MLYRLLILLIVILDLLVIINVLSGSADTGHKLLWTVIIVLLPVVGLVLYYFLGRDPRDRDITRSI